ncbi:MAG: RecX family transcriptional regulator [Erythrobacter sp.]|nr:RecX family transcriptional regulator [Erythrobacter sp.]
MPAREGRKGRPLDAVALRDLALSYVARFATTGAKLEGYLARKVRERGVIEDEDGRVAELDIRGLVEDFVQRGYIDDEAYAHARSRDLIQRGYGPRRISEALWAAGIEEGARSEAAPGEAQARAAAVLFARKRRLGPFAVSLEQEPPDSEARFRLREKRVAAMLRAGHDHAHARFILDADSEAQLEQWISEAPDDIGN